MINDWGFEPVSSDSFTRRSLSEAQSYRNSEVIELFRSSFNITEEDAIEVFQDLLSWMWGTSGRLLEGKPEIPLLLREEFFAMERMWRCFALFTEDYRAFCMGYLGVHLDFRPGSSLNDFSPTHMSVNDSFVPFGRRRSDQLNFILEQFGEKTLNRWLLSYPEKFSEENLTKE